jgi:lysozyme
MPLPRASLATVSALAAAAYAAAYPGRPMPDTYVVAVRAYYRDTMGQPGKNDYGIYDDAIFIVTPEGMSAWNGNTDPSRIGWNPGAGKYMARLKPGVWQFRRLKHHPGRPDGYMAFGQGDKPVTVERIREDGTVARTETGCFGINLHRGGVNGTSSEGCQTVPRDQWPLFDRTLAEALEESEGIWFPYILLEGPIV